MVCTRHTVPWAVSAMSGGKEGAGPVESGSVYQSLTRPTFLPVISLPIHFLFREKFQPKKQAGWLGAVTFDPKGHCSFYFPVPKPGPTIPRILYIGVFEV